VDDDPRGLVHDEQVLVLVCDPERHLLALQLARRGLRDHKLDLLASLEPMALHPPLPVDDRRPFLQQPLGGSARAHLGQRGQEAVEPLARGLGGDGDDQRDRVSPISSARKRIATPITMKLSARLKAGQ
jgi:hypothetical protein